MTRRIGANGRKNRVAKNKKLRTGSKIVLQKLLIVLVVAAAVLAIIYGSTQIGRKVKDAATESKFTDVRDIVIKGNKNVSSNEIANKLKPFISKKMYDIKKKVVQDSVGSIPWIEKVVVHTSITGKLTVKVKERKPIALVHKGKISHVDATGALFPLSKGGTTLLPLVSGLKDTLLANKRRAIVPRDIERLNSFLLGVKKVDPSLSSLITQIDLRSKEFHLLFQGTLVQVVVDNPERLRYYQRVQELVRTGTASSKINLCFENLAFVTQDEIVKEEKISLVSD